jgi:hypothetical protein
MDDGPVVDPDLKLAGYVLTVAADAPPGLSSLPPRIITISDCIMGRLPRPEFWDWYENLEDAVLARAWASQAQITPVAMRTRDAALLIDVMGGARQPFFATLRQALNFEGEVLGYEIVGAEETLDFHSWHCHGYADEVRDELNIQVNERGLLSTYLEASTVLRWMLALPDREAPEPVPWFVVALGAGIHTDVRSH